MSLGGHLDGDSNKGPCKDSGMKCINCDDRCKFCLCFYCLRMFVISTVVGGIISDVVHRAIERILP